jgi:glutamate carboxypeptidase
MVVNLESVRGEIFGRTLELLVELCTLSSPSGDADGLRQVAARLATELSCRGFSCTTTGESDANGVPQPVLVATGPADQDRRILLVGHIDTVLPAIPPRVVGDRLEATGALDMKGGLAALLGAIDLLVADGRPLPDGLTFVAVPDEESSGAISERVVRYWGARATAILVLEPGELRGDGESIVGGRRGLTEWQLEVVGRPAHSGLAYWAGRSALVAAADWCVRAQRLSIRGSGPTVNIGRLLAGTADFVDRLADNHDLLGTSRQRNSIPERAAADGEVRYLSDADGASAVAELVALAEAVAADHEVSATLTTGMSVPPFDPYRPGGYLVRRVVELSSSRGFRLEVENDRGGISFPNYLADTENVPVVDGLGPVGGGMHTRDEWLDLRSLDRRIVLLADLLATL